MQKVEIILNDEQLIAKLDLILANQAIILEAINDTPIPVPVPPTPEPPTPEPPTPDWIDFTEEYYKLINEGVEEIYLEAGKTYHVSVIKQTLLLNRKIKIYSGEERATLVFGVENYSPIIHGQQDGLLFLLHDNGQLVIENVNICQPKQLKTVMYWNPRIFAGSAWKDLIWTVAIKNCDTTAIGENGGFGLGFMYGSPEQNHVALINFKHYGTGLMDAKNSYEDSILYVTMRDIKTNAQEEAQNKLSAINFEHNGSLKDGVLDFDGDVYSLTSGYNYTWRDNDAYLVLWDRFTFFIDGYKEDSTPSNNKFRFRKQAEGKCKFHVMDSNSIYSNELEIHAGDKFDYKGSEYTVVSKDRIQYPFFDSRTTEAILEPWKARAIVYQLDKPLPIQTGEIEINYKGEKIEFDDQPITLLYKANGSFKTDLNTKYRDGNMIQGRGIGHLSYNHAQISMNAKDVEHLGFYRGSNQGKGISVLWNMVNCVGFDESGDYFMHSLPITQNDVPIPERITKIL
jgi:hypothetical protein